MWIQKMIDPLDHIELAITKQIPESWQSDYINETPLTKLQRETLEDSNNEELIELLNKWLNPND